MRLSKPTELESTKSEPLCMQILKNHLGNQEESQDGMQNITKQSNCIINV